MLWQNSDDVFEEEPQPKPDPSNQSPNKALEDLEQKKAVQLKKFQDPANDPERQAYIAIATQFGDLLANNYIDEIVITKVTEDCEFFIFDSTGKHPVKFALKPEAIKALYNGVQFQERIVQETYVDLVKSTVIQLSKYKIIYQDEKVPVEEYAIEIFTIKEGKIRKYRASFGSKPRDDEDDPLEQTKKDKILAKVKHINYALAGSQPDLNKVASLLSDNTEYKVWSWESQKCFTLSKRNFAEGFRNLETNFTIKCIVPYDVFTDKKYVMGTYAYYLEGKSGIYLNQKYVWVNTCIYVFDEKLNIERVSQQGELHKEDSVQIPFDGFSRELITQKIEEATKSFKPSLEMFYKDFLNFSCPIYRFAPPDAQFSGFVQGIDQVGKVLQTSPTKPLLPIEWVKLFEIYIDSGDASYDVVVTVVCHQLSLDSQSEGKKINLVNMTRVGLENGKIAKGLWFTSRVLGPIPSPFEDPEFETPNFKPKANFM